MARSRSNRRTWAAAALAASVIVSGSCRRDVAGSTLVIGTGADVDALVPVMVRGAQSAIVTDLLCDRLADLGPTRSAIGDDGFVPELAQAWNWNHDSSAVTFHLNEKARWHDGRPVLATDVAWSFQVLKDSDTASPNASRVTIVDSVVAVRGDPLAVLVFFNSRQVDRFYWVVRTLVPMPQHYYAQVRGVDWASDSAVRHPVCSGPYRLRNWQPKVTLTLEAVSDHYRIVPAIKTVIFAYRGDPQSGAQSTLAGELDFWEGVTTATLAQVSRNTATRLLPLPNFDYTFAAFNVADPKTGRRHPILGDAVLRRLLAAAAHPDLVRRNVWGDSLARTLRGPVVATQFTSDSSLTLPAMDSAEIAGALDRLGWVRGPDGVRAMKGRRLTLRGIVPSSSRPRVSAATVIQGQWRAQGIEFRFETLEFQTFVQRSLGREFDVTFAGWTTQPTPFSILTTWGTAGLARGTNLAGWTSPSTQAHFDSAAASEVTSEVVRHFRAAYRDLIDDPHAVWLYEPASYAVVNRRVGVPLFQTPFWWHTIPYWTLDAK